MKRVKRLGIYGGTFDPYHVGHHAAATAFVDIMSLDKLLLIPAKIPPHKQMRQDDDPYRRLEMLTAQYGEDGVICPCDYELRQDGVSYTVYTLSHFSKFADRIFMLVGTDMFLTLDRWYQADKIFSLCAVVCFGREGDGRRYGEIMAKKTEYERLFDAKILVPDYSPIEISSTYVREMLESGQDTHSLVPDKIAEYIRSCGMYRIYTEDDIKYIKDRLGQYISGHRLQHSLSVEECADRICAVQGIGGQMRMKIRIGALLHDIAKAHDGDQLSLSQRLGANPTAEDIKAPATLHALNGAYLARRDFINTVDDEIFGMIRYHCTGKANMTVGEKIVFLADYIEPGRDNAACVRVRNTYFDNNNEKNLQYRLDTAVFLAYDLTVGYLESKGGFIHTDTLLGRDCIKAEIEKTKGT